MVKLNVENILLKCLIVFLRKSSDAKSKSVPTTSDSAVFTKSPSPPKDQVCYFLCNPFNTVMLHQSVMLCLLHKLY